MTAFDNFFTAAAKKAEDPDEKDTIYRLRRMAIDRVDLVDAGANRRNFLIRKDERGTGTMKTADMIPGTEGIKNSAGVIVTKAEATAGADEDLQKLIEKMEGEGAEGNADLVTKLKSISKVLTAVAKAKKAEDEEEGEGAPAPAPAKPPEPAPPEESEEAKTAKIAKAAPAPRDPFDVIDAELDVIQKAGTRISKGNMDLLTKAMEILQKLSGNLTPEEKKAVQEKVAAVAKSLEQPAAQHIRDGNSKPAEAPVKPPEASVWSALEDINE